MNRILPAFVCILLLCCSAAAQSNVASSEIKGTVSDASGAVIPGATVTVTNPATGLSRSAVSNDRGEYRFLSLQPGTYDIKAEMTGFAPQQRTGAEVTVGQILLLDIRLQVGTSMQTIEVSTEAPVIETERAQQANTIQEAYIRTLPIDRRDYLTFTLLAPGVVDSNALADNSDFRVTQTPQSGLSFYGSNGRGNNVTVDGAEANDAAGGVRPTLSQEAVQEFQINRSNYTAELGGASGGVINIISKSGGNDLHGRLFAYFRHQSLDAADPFAIVSVNDVPARVKPDSNRQQFGATLGGPLKKDRSFIFLAFEGLQRNETSTVPLLTNSAIFRPTQAQAAVISALAANPSTTPIPCLPTVPGAGALPPAFCAGALSAALTAKQSTVDLFKANSGVFPFETDSKMFSVRLDHRASNSNQLFFRYNWTLSDDDNQSTRALVGFSRSNNVHQRDSTAAAGWTGIMTPNLVNEARFQWNYRNFFVRPNETFGPEMNISGYGFFGRDIFLPNFTVERRYEISDGISYSRGRHRMKFGVNVLLRGNRSDSHTFFGGRFGFGALPGALLSPPLGAAPITALQAFDLGLPQSYQQGFGDPTVSATVPFYAVYAQDAWSLRPNFTLNFGLRYELDDRRDPIPTDKNNFAPRFGFSWDPMNNKKTVIRGGFGIFYSPTYFQIDHVVNSLAEINGYRQIAQLLTTLNAANPLAANGPINIWQKLRAQGVIGVPTPTRMITPADLTQFGIQISQTGPRPPLTVLFEIDPNYRSAYSQQASLGIDHEIAHGFSMSANYIFASTLKVTRARDVNLLPRPASPQLGISDWTSTTGGCGGAGIVNCFRNPLLFQENVYESSARAFYHGMILEASRRFSRTFSMAANYTYSKAIDEVTDFNSDFQPMDQTKVQAERALSAFDQRHKFVVYAFISTPWRTGSGGSALKNLLADTALTPILRANSARPFNLLTGTDLNGDRHSTTDRPAFAGRNTGKGPEFWTFDLRLSRQIRMKSEQRGLEISIEGFNLLNHLNFASVNNTVGPSYSGPHRVEADRSAGPSSPLGFTSAFDARRIQIGFKLNF